MSKKSQKVYEGKLSIELGHLPYPRPVFILTYDGKLLNLAEELKSWDGTYVKIVVEEDG